ncbi:UDP-glycosyltransferase 91A1-like [Dendrobium catenatum]|uniref:UDP-glycosyltransferase 91A1-like n=1 Tax=Dendrobium catenatum TaxID=906689 RepID=UPI00109F685E|nr:UDP-glycosyltransferase 91A1-like [Dendrobium catenatum]
MEEENGKLHIVMVPWLAMGHLLPFFELSKSLALKGIGGEWLTRSKWRGMMKILERNCEEVEILMVEEEGEELSQKSGSLPASPPRCREVSDGSTRPERINGEEIWESDRVHGCLRSLDRINSTAKGFGGPDQPRDFLQIFIPQIPTGYTEYTRIPRSFANSEFFLGKTRYNFGITRTAAKAFLDRFRIHDSPEKIPTASDLIPFPKRTFKEFEAKWIDCLAKIVIPVGFLTSSIDEEESETMDENIPNGLIRQKEQSVIYVGFGAEAISY